MDKYKIFMMCIGIFITILLISIVYQNSLLTTLEWTISFIVGWTGMDLIKGKR